MPTAQARCCPPVDPSDTSGPPMYLTYVDSTGTFWNTYAGMHMTLVGYGWTDPITGVSYTLTDAFGKCIRTQPSPAGYGKWYDPIDCPCCPDNYVFADWRLWANATAATPCQSLVVPYSYVEPVPCIACVCPPEPPPPPPCVACSAQQNVLPIHFVFNQATKKVCTDCGVIGEPSGLGTGADAFMPIQILDPIINFTRTP